MRVLRSLGPWVLLLTAVFGVVEANERYDPRLKFRTITTAHFDIHFHQGEDAIAKRLAVVAEQVAAEMVPKLGRPRMRVNVILVDQSDVSNGWATPVPYNLIEINAAAPRAESIIGNTTDWLRLAFTHEYTHVLHLERSRGWIGAIGRPFGRLPLVYPNLYLPPMLIEGIATHEEGGSSAEGRPHAGDFRMIGERAAASGRFPSLARASNQVVDWPSGNTRYVFGSHFHDYLAATYGEDSVERLANETSGRLPYLGSRAFRTVYGKSLGDLWSDFRSTTTKRSSIVASDALQLTRHGFVVGTPFHSPDGRLFYTVADPHEFPALMELTPQGTHKIATQVNATHLGGTTDHIVFDQLEYIRSIGLQSDLFSVDRRSHAVRRLTRAARASDPHVTQDGATIVCTVQTPTGRILATMPVPASGREGVPTPLLDEPDVDYAAPRWSPDGRSIAVERRQLGGLSQVVLVDVAARRIERTIGEAAGTRSSSPAWSRDGHTVYFASAPAERPFTIHSLDLASGEVRRLANAGESAQSPDVSPDGATLVFVGYTVSGFDLFSLPLSQARWEAVERSVTQQTTAAPSVAAAPTAFTDSSYNPLRTLAPRFWSPIIETSDDELSVGGTTGGVDALGRHSYFGGVSWSTRARPDWFAAYLYDRWRPTLFADISDDTDPWREGTNRTTEFTAGALMWFRRVRRTQLLYGSFHGATERFGCGSCSPLVDATFKRRAIRAAWSFDAARTYGYSISDEEGFSITTSAEWTAEALGSTGDATAAIADTRAFLRLGPRHAVVAIRAAGATAWGDPAVRRQFAPGGAGPVGGIDFDVDAISLVRGFDTDDLAGRRAVVINVDYRFPLLWVERGVGTWPLFLRSLHGAAFTDFGAAWETSLDRNNRRASAGFELASDVVLGYSFPVTAAAGVAWRRDPTGRSDGATLFWRIGRAF